MEREYLEDREIQYWKSMSVILMEENEKLKAENELLKASIDHLINHDLLAAAKTMLAKAENLNAQAINIKYEFEDRLKETVERLQRGRA